MNISDDKKKTIYIGLIIFCLVTTAAIIFINMRGPSVTPIEETAPATEAAVPPTTAGTPTTPGIAAQLKMINDAAYPAVSVFPTQRQFDMSLFSSQNFLYLTSQELPAIAPEEFGADENPFRSIIKKQ